MKAREELLAPFPTLRELDVPEEHLRRVNEQKQGSQRCHIAKDAYLDDLLMRLYGRGGLCLKVFGKLSLTWAGWEGTHLAEATKVQNLFAWEGLAPRVYDLVTVGGGLAQVTDYLEPEKGKPDRDGFDRVMDKYGLKAVARKHHYKYPEHNWIGARLVDFGGLRFANPAAYKDALRKRADYQDHGKPYQEAFGGDAFRDLAHRLEVFRFDEIDFAGKTVLDVGCNLGAFVREALWRGAVRAVGVDKHKAQVAYELANWLGAWNADFLPLSLPDQWGEVEARTGIGCFDVVLDLAVVGHTGGLPRAPCGLMVFEGHRHKREHYEPMLQERFESVRFLGHTTDMGKRPVFWCEGDKW